EPAAGQVAADVVAADGAQALGRGHAGLAVVEGAGERAVAGARHALVGRILPRGNGGAGAGAPGQVARLAAAATGRVAAQPVAAEAAQALAACRASLSRIELAGPGRGVAALDRRALGVG